MNVTEIAYNSLKEATKAGITPSDIVVKDGSVTFSKKAESVLETLHDLDIIADLIRTYTANQKEVIYEQMKGSGHGKAVSIDVNNAHITVKPETQSTSTNSQKLREKFPEVFEQVKQVSTRKGVVTIDFMEEIYD